MTFEGGERFARCPDMDVLQELKDRLDAVVRQLQEALSEAVLTRGEVEQFSSTSKSDVAAPSGTTDEPEKT